MSPLTISSAQVEALLNSSVRQPPQGVTQYVDTHWGDEYWYHITFSLCFSIISILVMLRAYVKLKIMRKSEPADYFIFISYIICIGLLVIGKLPLAHGQGADLWNIRLKHYIKLLYYVNIMNILYGIVVFTIKVAVVLQYLRLFAPNRTVNPFVFYSSWAIIISCVLFYSGYTVVTIFACTPREKIWNRLYPGGRCLNQSAIVVSAGLFNVISDVAILLLPMRTVWGLRIPTQKKLSISALFCTGLLACIAAIMRVQYAMKITLYGTRVNVSYYIAVISMWSYAEITAGVFVACVLTMSKLCNKLVQGNGDKICSLFSKISTSIKSSHRPGGDASSVPPPLPPVNGIGISSIQLVRLDKVLIKGGSPPTRAAWR